ncbi:MAG: hypothetical protein M3Y49_20110 [Actinomycetota bacterium]|nr:hypothetical protein [Actinomycetota bacterium]
MAPDHHKDPNNPNIVQTEMLPGTYSFAATYNGTRDQKKAVVLEPNSNNGADADQIVYFGFGPKI